MSIGSSPSIASYIVSDNISILYSSAAKISIDNSKFIVYITEPFEAYTLKNADGTPSSITFPIQPSSLHCVYTVKYDPNNNPVWAAMIDVKDATVKAPNLTIDSLGNIFVIIETADSGNLPDVYNVDGTLANLQLEPYIHGTPGATFIIKYSNLGTPLMIFELQGCSNTIGVSLDKNANVYVATSMFNSDVYLTSTDIDTVTALPKDGSVLVAKFTSDGTYTWSRSMDGVIDSLDICVDYSTGDTYIPIKYDGGAKFFETSQIYRLLPSFENLTGLLIKIDRNGSLKWSVELKGLELSNDVISVAIDKYQNIYIVFAYNYTNLENEPCVIDAIGRKHMVYIDAIDQIKSCALVRMTSDGVFLWKASIQNIHSLNTNIVFDYMSNVIINIKYTGSTTKIQDAQSQSISLPVIGFKTVVLTSLNPDGRVLWKKILALSQDSDTIGHLSCSQDSFRVAYYINFTTSQSTLDFVDGEQFTPLANSFGGLVSLAYTMSYPAIQGGITMEESVQVFGNAQSNDMTLYCTKPLQKIHMGHSLDSASSMLQIDRYRVTVNTLEVTSNTICHNDLYVLQDVNILGDIYQKGNPLSVGQLTIDTPSTSNIDPIKQWSILSNAAYTLTSSLTSKQNGLVKIITNNENASTISVSILDSNASNTLSTLNIGPQSSRMLAWYNTTWFNLGSFGS